MKKTVNTITRFPPATHALAVEAARELGISLNAFTILAVFNELSHSEWLDHQIELAKREQDDGK